MYRQPVSAPLSSLTTSNKCPSSTDWEDNMPVIIETSHQRSIAYGLQPSAASDFGPAGKTDVSLLIEQNRVLHTHAVPAMETLYQQIVNTHNMVILTDANGVILHSLGDDDFLEKANRVALQPGVTWSEQSKGTNAIGTAIAEKTPTLVHADQHYLHGQSLPHLLGGARSPTIAAMSSACSTFPATSAAFTSTRWRWCACRR